MKSIVIMKGNKVFEGDFIFHKTKPKFLPLKNVKKIEDIKNIDLYLNFDDKHKLFGLKLTKKEVKDYLSLMGIKKLLFINELPSDNSNKETKKYWWKYINAICQKCELDCKQSSKVELIVCEKYKGE